MSIKIIGDSTMDLSKKVQDEVGIHCVPFSVEFGNDVKKDGSFPNEEMYQYNATHKDICRSSAVNVGEALKFFEEEGKDGDELLYFSISSKLSSGFQNASIAAEEFKNVSTFDSQSASLGIALQALKAKEMAEEGKSMKEILEVMEQYRHSTNVSLIVDDLTFMARGGRISKAAAIGAGLLKFHPILTVKDGSFSVLKKLMGKIQKLGVKYVDSILEGYEEIDYSLALVGYTSERDSTVDDIVNELKAKGFKKVVETKTNSTNAVHSGPNTYGVAYICSMKPGKYRFFLGQLSDQLNEKATQKAIEKELIKYKQ